MAFSVTPTPLRGSIAVADDFLSADFAAAMRQDIDAHFASPQAHRAETQQIGIIGSCLNSIQEISLNISEPAEIDAHRLPPVFERVA